MFRVQDSGFRVQGFRCHALSAHAWRHAQCHVSIPCRRRSVRCEPPPGFRVYGFGVSVEGSGFRVFRVQSSALIVESLDFRVQVLVVRV